MSNNPKTLADKAKDGVDHAANKVKEGVQTIQGKMEGKEAEKNHQQAKDASTVDGAISHAVDGLKHDSKKASCDAQAEAYKQFENDIDFINYDCNLNIIEPDGSHLNVLETK
ncbi:unnamed protein product [Didymodactylos carnosus]|uniref:Uncharacterized protein n=1 Tax=Didymodactylos carnosus TaxID=1234261 RepID=A0A813ZTV0_9BILA|nr:unnamed protein product [Didymodactylos carnosus]CAF0932229.1 unnamed protein product [Didymodactylos carnosus]CAF3686114.1 unnamed protein product [Didymodactylos carnosus]CAF3708600.1 unnamed protein product [Didymodactylos carnosus]